MRLLTFPLILFLISSGCGTPRETPVEKRTLLGFSSAPIKGTSMQGGSFEAGLIVVSHETGQISSCWKTCQVIGQMEPTDRGGLTVEAAPTGLKAYIVNDSNGHVVECELHTDMWVEKFNGGSCKDVGSAAQSKPATPPRP